MSRKTVSESTFNKPVSMADSLNVTGSVAANSLDITAGINVGGSIGQENNTSNSLGKTLEIGSLGVDQSAIIDLHASSDVSQNNYSTRIIRDSGVDGALSITNLGGGNVVIGSTGTGALNLIGGSINANNLRIVNVADPASLLDSANKQYVDDTVNGQGWVAYCRYNGETGAILSESGINTWSRTAEGRYTMTFDSGIMSTPAYGAFTMQSQTSSSISYCGMEFGKTTSGGTVYNVASGGSYDDGSDNQITFFFGGQ